MRKDILVLGVVCSLIATTADAQFAGLLAKRFGLPSKGEVGGSYQSNNQIRTYITTDPFDDAQPYEKLISKASDMASERGFTRIGVTKNSCTTAVVGGSPRSTSCYIIAVMLNGQETAKSRGSREVRYYDVKDVDNGVIAPLPVSGD